MAKDDLHSGDAVLSVVADKLEQGAKWVPAGSLREGGAPASIPTLFSHLLEALGCDPRAGALAYWDWERIQELTGTCWEAIAAVTVAKPQLWSNAPDRTVDEVLAALRSASCDVVVPDEPFGRRPWSSPTVVRTCRIPFVPVASVAAVWLSDGGALGAVLERLSIVRTTGPWDVLRLADPFAQGVEEPAELRKVTDSIRKSMIERTPAQYSPAAGLQAVADAFDGVPSTVELEAWAEPAGEAVNALEEIAG